MTQLTNIKHHYRRPKQKRGKEKFENILDFAEALIQDGQLETFTLPDIVDGLGISGGALYHFFPSKDALLVALTDRALNRFTDLVGTVDRQGIHSWRELIERVSRASWEYHLTTPSIMLLVFGPGSVWQVRLADSAGNARIAKSLALAFRETFDFSFIPETELEELLLDLITIQDAFWRKSYEVHGTISEDYFERSIEAGVAYLKCRIPETVRFSTPTEHKSVQADGGAELA